MVQAFTQEPAQALELVYLLWIILLVIAVGVILPLTVYLLRRILIAARNVQASLGEMRDAGAGIAGNVHRIAELDDTIQVAGQMLGVARSIKDHAATIEMTLAARAYRDKYT